MNNITNRKVVKTGDVGNDQKVEWLKIQWINFKQSEPLLLHYKYSNNEEVPFSIVNIKKRTTTEVMQLDVLYPNGRKIDEPKNKDLMSLLEYIPPIKHSFYTSILSSGDIPSTVPVDEEEDELV
ncbi:hypothetical protein J6590_096966 [Homalodisca vitripennis]|nr:hypothetical protein J6590_096966 [Homalodisca vitripennis]